jgi:undecaprenyl-diphosphatase
LAAVIGFFLRDLLRMIAAAAKPATRKDLDARMLLYIVAGTVPIGVVGLLARHAIEGPLRSILVIASSMIVVGIVMAIVEKTARHERTIESFTLRDALIVGMAQSLALVPGTSRSGITLVAAMILGFRRDAAARFSFLLSIPAVAAAGVFELPKLLHDREVGTTALVDGPAGRRGVRLSQRGLAAALPAHAHDLRLRRLPRDFGLQPDCRRARRE